MQRLSFRSHQPSQGLRVSGAPTSPLSPTWPPLLPVQFPLPSPHRPPGLIFQAQAALPAGPWQGRPQRPAPRLPALTWPAAGERSSGAGGRSKCPQTPPLSGQPRRAGPAQGAPAGSPAEAVPARLRVGRGSPGAEEGQGLRGEPNLCSLTGRRDPGWAVGTHRIFLAKMWGKGHFPGPGRMKWTQHPVLPGDPAT